MGKRMAKPTVIQGDEAVRRGTDVRMQSDGATGREQTDGSGEERDGKEEHGEIERPGEESAEDRRINGSGRAEREPRADGSPLCCT